MGYNELFTWLEENHGKEVSDRVKYYVQYSRPNWENISGSLWDLLVSGFSWNKTIEGASYWGNIANELQRKGL